MAISAQRIEKVKLVIGGFTVQKPGTLASVF
jgi:hypothetical protein